jgi:hypothetical protein
VKLEVTYLKLNSNLTDMSSDPFASDPSSTSLYPHDATISAREQDTPLTSYVAATLVTSRVVISDETPTRLVMPTPESLHKPICSDPQIELAAPKAVVAKRKPGRPRKEKAATDDGEKKDGNTIWPDDVIVCLLETRYKNERILQRFKNVKCNKDKARVWRYLADVFHAKAQVCI